MVAPLDISGLRRADDPELVAWVAAGLFGGSPPVVDPPVNTLAPSITGNPTRGSILTRTAGVWLGADSVAGQWRKNGVAIGGATGATYAIPGTAADADVFDYLETASNAAGSASSASNAIVARVVTVAAASSAGAFPGETLTASGGTGAYQWTKDGNNIAGATGASYVIGVRDIGSVIRCVRDGIVSDNALTCWHPRDLPGVFGVWLANVGLLNALAAPCIDGDAVATWQDQSGNGFHLLQATASARPTAQLVEVAGNNTVLFDGTDDRLGFASGSAALDAFSGKSYGYLVTAALDTNSAGGAASHTIAGWTTATGGARFRVTTRMSNNYRWTAGARQLDADGFREPFAAASAGYHAVTGIFNGPAQSISVQADGATVGSLGFTSAGPFEATTSGLSSTGIGGVGGSYFPGHICGLIAAAPSAPWSATDLSRANRYLGLLCGLNIPLA